MTAIDWLLVLVINGGIVLYGICFHKRIVSSSDWYLAAKTLPWWSVGLSAFATAVDTGDYVAIAGGSYRFGLSQLSQWWLGMAVGWFVLNFFVIIPLYRSGVYTNAEWLEFRFGPTARVLAVLINIQSRTIVVGNIFFSAYLVLQVLTDLGPFWSWTLVVVVAATSVWYVVAGGLESTVLTNAVQALAMIVASFVLWGFVWTQTGGWRGLHQKLASVDPQLPQVLLHVGGYSPEGVPPALVIFGFVVVLVAYAVINQYEAIRFLGARSEWDFKMAALVASVITSLCLWFNVSMGPLARADFPDLQIVDQAYPLMVKKYLPPGLVGIVVTGLVAAAYSTFSSIGIGIASLFVRDVYARFAVRKASDMHYTRVGKICVPLALALGFVYLPFLKSGMLAFSLRLIGAIWVPLMAVVLLGVFTKVHRATGTVGLLAGLAYGISAILADFLDWPLPLWYKNTWWTYLWNIVVTAGSMLVASKILDWRRGPVRPEELRGLLYTRRAASEDSGEWMSRRLQALEGTWLQETLRQAEVRPSHPFGPVAAGPRWFQRPELYVALYLASVCYLLFVVLW